MSKRGQHSQCVPCPAAAPKTTGVSQVFEYFSERTPRSVVETRSTSVVWNYRESDYEFGRTQAQDMLQHLLTGSISNSAVDVVRGSRSVEVRTFGVNKGVSMSRTIDLMARKLGHAAVAFDHVMCVGHFMSRDESIFAYFEGARSASAVLHLACWVVPGAERGLGPLMRARQLLRVRCQP